MNQIASDVCIVGSGVAGSIVALECVRAGLDVTMVEAGSPASGRPLALRALENTLRDFRIPRMSLWHRRHRYRPDEYSSGGDPGYGLPGKALPRTTDPKEQTDAQHDEIGRREFLEGGQ